MAEEESIQCMTKASRLSRGSDDAAIDAHHTPPTSEEVALGVDPGGPQGSQHSGSQVGCDVPVEAHGERGERSQGLM